MAMTSEYQHNLSLFSLQCDAEVNFLEGHVGLPQYALQQQPQQQQQQQQQQPQQPPQPGSQLEMVLAEARRLEEVAHRNEDELRLLAIERGDEDDPNIRAEIMQLKQRLAGTDQELQKTNQTLRYAILFTNTVWKFLDFAASTQILCEINFG